MAGFYNFPRARHEADRQEDFNSLIPQSFIQDLLARLDIVEVVERYVPLKKAGANMVACCPFHSERTPSFSVSQAKQFYHCFGCGAHGSAIGFVMEFNGIGFIDAVSELATSLGMQVPHSTMTRPAPTGDDPPLIAVMERSARFYRESLKSSGRAIDYLKGRGITGESAARFGIGYAPDGWQSLQRALPDVGTAQLLECGLIIEHETGSRYDRFRDRIMFPIQNSRGRVIAFGGRILDQGEPKYLNSPETALFEKGRELYGLPQAREAVRACDTVIVVEGYMDVVMLAQQGISNVVATLGTATTPIHVQKLQRSAHRVVYCFDGDAAGRKAARRALDASLECAEDDRSIAFLFLPSQHDPDTYVQEHGPERFQQIVAEAGSAVDYFIQELRRFPERGSPAGNAQVLAHAKPVLDRVRAPRLRAQLAFAVARLVGMVPASPREAERLLDLPMLANTSRHAYPSSPPRRAPESATRKLLKTALRHPDWCAAIPVEIIGADDAESAALRAVIDAVDHGELPNGGLGTVVEYFRASAHEALLADLVREMSSEPTDDAETETEFNDTIQQLRRGKIAQEIASLSTKERSSGLSATERTKLAALLLEKQRLRNSSEEPIWRS